MTLVLVGSLVLAAVFATAGGAKVRDLSGSREAMRGFGVPPSLAAPLGVTLPFAELAVAVALLAGPTRTLGALGALTLLAGFSLAIAWNLARGHTPDCHCFGQLHSSPAGPRTLARNAALIALAGFVTSQADLTSSALAVAAGFAIAAAGWALSRREAPAGSGGVTRGLAVGAPAPSFKLPAIEGYKVSLQSLLAPGKPVLLVFSDPHCGPCQELAPDIAQWQHLYSDEITIAVIERIDGAPVARPDDHGRRTVLLQRETEVADSYGAQGTPTAVVIGADGRVTSPVAGGSAGIAELVAQNVAGFKGHPVEVEGGSTWTVPVRFGGPLGRRELLVRSFGTAAAGTVLARPLRAFGLGRSKGAPKCDRDRDCPEGTACRGGRCLCEGGFFIDRCRGECTNFDIDDRHCGGCRNRECGPDEDCYGGRCVPRSGDGSACAEDCNADFKVCCQGQCRDLSSDSVNCGGCGISCGPGQTCCLGRCIYNKNDPRYCGGCFEGVKCAPDQVCHAGKCRDKCPKPLRQCGQRCGNPRTQTCCGKRDLIDKDDIANGFVGCCGGRAMDVSSDVENCGSCGCRCVGRQECTCQNGECFCPGPLDGSCFFSP